MKIALIIITISITFIIVYFIILGANSKSGNADGLLYGKLHQCPDQPNCVCSEQNEDTDHYIPPLDLSDKTASGTLKVFKEIILELKGEIKAVNETYLSATFSSFLFGFVDDFEMRIDLKQNVIHFRSASRVGHSDLGANKKRIELLKKLFIEKTQMANATLR